MTDPVPSAGIPPSIDSLPGAPTSDSPTGFRDEDLVYVDPDTKSVVGRVEWSRNGNPKSRTFVAPVKPDDKGERKRGGRKHYPWGTYKSMKAVFKIEGKPKKHEATKTLDEIMEKALKEAFWD